MKPIYDIKKIERVLSDFHRATGVTITYYTPDFVGISAEGTSSSRYCTLIAKTPEGGRACSFSNNKILQKCREEKKPQRHICSAGLVDMAVPLLDGDEILGYLMLGQLRVDGTLPKVTEAFSVDRELLKSYFDELPLFNEETVSSIMNLASMLTKYIMLENLIRSGKDENAYIIRQYIDNHLTEELSAERLAEATHLSLSGVYKCVRRAFGCTVGELVASRRIAHALPLLEKNKLSVEAVSEAVGFSDAAYFSRRFKKEMGISPLKYRIKTGRQST
jgi:AraC-like DNA-binding protein